MCRRWYKMGVTRRIPIALFALALLTTTAAAPGEPDVPRCSSGCLNSGVPKLSYALGKTYSYTYLIESKIAMEKGKTGTGWSSTVEMTSITPCDLVIKFSNTKIDGTEGPPHVAGFLERYPLVVAHIDGRVQHVCTHPHDAVWAINIKKGVASAIQNSLPSLNISSSPLTLMETDVVGNCTTQYKTKKNGEMISVEKKRDCNTHQKVFSSYLLSKSSECDQQIINGYYNLIVCTDISNAFHYQFPHDGMKGVFQAMQQSTLSLQSVSNASSSLTASTIQAEMVQDSLLYDHRPLKKDPSLVAQLYGIISQICEKTKKIVEPDVASLVNKAVHLLRLVPEAAVAQTLEKIRNGYFCTDSRRLESIFLDMVTFIHESSAVEVIVKELVNGTATGNRAALYANALCSISQPNAFAIEALKPLMESSQYLTSANLCGASMVKAFCLHKDQCHEEEPVKGIADILTNNLEWQCSPEHKKENPTAAFVTLKALGNMGVMTSEVLRTVIGCIENQQIDTGVRVVAVEAFRNVECGHLPLESLTDFTMNSSMNTEVRIASYLAVIRCAGERELQRIISVILQEENIQVRSFISSHLANLQKSNGRHKEALKELLSNAALPDVFESDVRNHSSNMGISYIVPTVGVAIDAESNIVYTPESDVPRSFDINLITDSNGKLSNIFKVGTRLEGLEIVYEQIFGSDGNLKKSNLSDFIRGIFVFVKENRVKVMGEMKRILSQRDPKDIDVMSNSDSENNSEEKYEKASLHVFARIMGQDLAFATLTGDPLLNSADWMIKAFFAAFNQIIDNFEITLDSPRVSMVDHHPLDYFAPTIQGIPFMIKGELTAVNDIKVSGMQNIFQLLSGTGKKIGIRFSSSSQQKTFVGYDSHIVKEGFMISTRISSNNNFLLNLHMNTSSQLEIKLNVPDMRELGSVDGQVYFMKKIFGKQEKIILSNPEKCFRDPRSFCVPGLESLLGLKFCLGYVTADIHTKYRIFIEKSDLSIKAYSLKVSPDYMQDNFSMIIQAETAGVSKERKISLRVNHTHEDESEKLKLLFDSSDGSVEVITSIINQNLYKNIEAYVKYRWSEMRQTYCGFKIDLTKRMDSFKEQKYVMKVFSNRTDDDCSNELQILEGNLNVSSKGEETGLDMELKTMDALTSRLSFNLEVGIDVMYTQYFQVPVLSRIRKYEFFGKLGFFNAVSYLRKTNDSGYESLFRISAVIIEILSLQANHTLDGSWHQSEASLNTSATVRVHGIHSFDVVSNISYANNGHNWITITDDTYYVLPVRNNWSTFVTSYMNSQCTGSFNVFRNSLMTITGSQSEKMPFITC